MTAIFRTLTPAELATEPGRSLYIDIIGARAEVEQRFGVLHDRLAQVIAAQEPVPLTPTPWPFRLAPPGVIRDKLDELRGKPLRFAVAQFDAEHRGEESVDLLEGMARIYDRAGLRLTARGMLEIASYGTVLYGPGGLVTAAPDADVVGKNVLQLAAAFVEQDFALVLDRNGTMVYAFDCCMLEKTPKHVETGRNHFMGLDFYEWHERIPGWGHFLAGTFRKLDRAMRDRLIEMLYVDLRGRHRYSDGQVTVQRFERDYVLPLWNLDRRYVGFAVIADNYMMQPEEKLRPFEGGPFLRFDSQSAFHEAFRVIAPFQHHPHGMRTPDGREAPEAEA